jgi:hypothetical protein
VTTDLDLGDDPEGDPCAVERLTDGDSGFEAVTTGNLVRRACRGGKDDGIFPIFLLIADFCYHYRAKESSWFTK